jgi:hypothetical protein
MRKFAIALLADAGALFTGSANAADVYTSNEYANAEPVQQVRLVCDEGGRCYRIPPRAAAASLSKIRTIMRRVNGISSAVATATGMMGRGRDGFRAPGVSLGVRRGSWNGACGERARFSHEQAGTLPSV